MINKGLYSNKYPRYIEIEYWEHIITCKVIDREKKIFIWKLYNKLQKYHLYESIQNEIIAMLHDIKKYLLFEYNKVHKTKQVEVSLKALFRGYIV